MTRIGDLLIQQGVLLPGLLARTLADRPPGVRLASALIAAKVVEFDDASRALGEQKGLPCALAKHLAARDEELAKLVPAELGRASCVLPLGQNSRGELIVCVRDPSPSLLDSLRQAVKRDVLMVIAPAQRLEELVVKAYGPLDEQDFDIDFELDGAPEARSPKPAPARKPAPPAEPPAPQMDAIAPESTRIVMSEIDDVELMKQALSGQSVPAPSPRQFPRAPTPPPVVRVPPKAEAKPEPKPEPKVAAKAEDDFDFDLEARPDPKPESKPEPAPAPRPAFKRGVASPAIVPRSTPPKGVPVIQVPEPSRTKTAETPQAVLEAAREATRTRTADVAPAVGRATTVSITSSIESTKKALSRATTQEEALDHVLAYMTSRWAKGVVLQLRTMKAVGHRGHGVLRLEQLAVPITQPSTVQRAIESKAPSRDMPTSTAQQTLAAALGAPSQLSAAPVVLAGHVAEVIAVGDPIKGRGDVDSAFEDLGKLAGLLASAYERISST